LALNRNTREMSHRATNNNDNNQQQGLDNKTTNGRLAKAVESSFRTPAGSSLSGGRRGLCFSSQLIIIRQKRREDGFAKKEPKKYRVATNPVCPNDLPRPLLMPFWLSEKIQAVELLSPTGDPRLACNPTTLTCGVSCSRWWWSSLRGGF